MTKRARLPTWVPRIADAHSSLEICLRPDRPNSRPATRMSSRPLSQVGHRCQQARSGFCIWLVSSLPLFPNYSDSCRGLGLAAAIPGHTEGPYAAPRGSAASPRARPRAQTVSGKAGSSGQHCAPGGGNIGRVQGVYHSPVSRPGQEQPEAPVHQGRGARQIGGLH